VEKPGMKTVTIIADSAAQALAEVHRQLGPQAVVVNVRKTSAPGLSRIWKKPQIELQATLPTPAVTRPKPEAVSELNKKIEELKQQLSSNRSRPRARPAPEKALGRVEEMQRKPVDSPAPVASPANEGLDLTRMLENLGILPLHAQWLADQVRARQVGQERSPLKEEFIAVQDFLLQYWNRLAARHRQSTEETRILVGTPGVGKTTCLCKWLTQEVLIGNQQARVWRLDGNTANTAEFLSIYGEILAVPVERVWTPESANETNPGIQYVDLPGVCATDGEGIALMAEQIKVFHPAQVFLVLNAAYDLNHLVAHTRAFGALPLAGIILAHVDEENRWSKFWNLLLGAKLPVLYLSGGQNIPGDFGPASPQSLFDVSVSQQH
jgi:flagellar biosynthesis protein FlhF